MVAERERLVLVKRDHETGQYILRSCPAGRPSCTQVVTAQTAQIMADYIWANYPDQKVQWLLL